MLLNNDSIIIIIIFGIIILALCNFYFSQDIKPLNIPPVIIPDKIHENFSLNDAINNGKNIVENNIVKTKNQIETNVNSLQNKLKDAKNQIQNKVTDNVSNIKNIVQNVTNTPLVLPTVSPLVSTPVSPPITTITTIDTISTYADDRLNTNNAKTVKYPDSNNTINNNKLLFHQETPLQQPVVSSKTYIDPTSYPPQDKQNNLPSNKEVCENKSVYINNAYYILKDGMVWNNIDPKYNACGNPYNKGERHNISGYSDDSNFEYDEYWGISDNPADFDFADYLGNKLVKMKTYIEDPETRGGNIGNFDKYAGIGDIGNLPLTNNPKNPFGYGYVFKPMNNELRNK
jgi:hypothetical protein